MVLTSQILPPLLSVPQTWPATALHTQALFWSRSSLWRRQMKTCVCMCVSGNRVIKWGEGRVLRAEGWPLTRVCVAIISVCVLTLVWRWRPRIVRPFSPSCVINPINSTLIHTSCFGLTLSPERVLAGADEEGLLAYHLLCYIHFNLPIVSL